MMTYELFFGELHDIYLNRVRCASHDSSIANEAACGVVEFGGSVDGVTRRGAQERRFYRQSEFLGKHSKKPIHRVILAGVGANHEFVAAKADSVSGLDIHFKAAGLNTITGHFNNQTIG